MLGKQGSKGFLCQGTSNRKSWKLPGNHIHTTFLPHLGNRGGIPLIPEVAKIQASGLNQKQGKQEQGVGWCPCSKNRRWAQLLWERLPYR